MRSHLGKYLVVSQFSMPMLPAAQSWAQADFLSLRYRPDLNLLVGRWQRPVSEAEFRQGYQATLRAAQATDCPFWQLDIRGRQAPAPTSAQWLLAEFIPQITNQLACPVCLGYLLRPTHLAQQPAAPAASEDVRMAFFAEEGPLTAWLAQCQRRCLLALGPELGPTPPLAA